jgi:signal transduction histidine kinase/CheY-like chemotaxis protein
MSKVKRSEGDRPAFAGAPEDLLGRPNTFRRLAITGLVALAAAPILPLAWVAGWIAASLAVTAAEHWLVARRGYVGSDAAGVAVTFAISVVSAAAAYELIQHGEGGGRFFAVALIGFTTVQILLRYFTSTTLFLAAASPQVAILAVTCWGIASRHLAAENHLRALTPVAVLAVYALLLFPTRKRLADAWRRLETAKTAAEQASQTKSKFLATMSDEIRTPLNGVLGMAQAMSREPLSATQRERLSVIRRSGETLASILNDVLDLSRIEQGQLKLETVEFDMEHVTRGAAATFGPLAAAKGLAFEFSIGEAARGAFRGDSVRLRQILYNLVSNAVKFTEAGGVAVSVSYAGGMLVLEVADSGVGISDDKLPLLFEKFVQGDASTTRRHGGAGLGLALCKRLAELMGGRIDVSSVRGKGSLFTARLPMTQVTPGARAPAGEPCGASEPPRLRVLAAEDNEVNQLVLRTLLSQAGLEATVVANGAEAVEAWAHGAWDVILMDVQMPVMDGVDATREIRARELGQGRRRTPIIAVTANAMPHQVSEYLAAGMDAVAVKPLDVPSLFAAMAQVLGEAALPAVAAA